MTAIYDFLREPPPPSRPGSTPGRGTASTPPQPPPVNFPGEPYPLDPFPTEPQAATQPAWPAPPAGHPTGRPAVGHTQPNGANPNHPQAAHQQAQHVDEPHQQATAPLRQHADPPADPPRLPHRNARIAMVVDTLSTHQSRLTQGLEAGLRRHGMELLVYVARREDAASGGLMTALLGQAGLSGLVSTAYPLLGGLGSLDDAARRLGDLPTVVVGTQLPHMSTVACDNAASMAALMTHLLDEGGVRHPAFVRGPLNRTESKERERAFRVACEERGIEVVESRFVRGEHDRMLALRATMALLRNDPAVDCVVAANDDMAEGVLDALAELGLDVPTQVKVTGFDGDARSARTRPPLTTIDQRLHEQGEAAADLLAAQLDGDRQARSVRIEGRLIVRRSTRPYRAAPTRRLSPDAVNAGRDALFQVVQAEIGPCPPVVDGTWARRWLERLRDQMESGSLDEAWIRSWGRPTGTVDDLERATAWLAGASRVVLDLVWRQFRSDESSFAAADVHGQVVARLAVVRADGTRSSDRADIVSLRHVIAMDHALAAAASFAQLTEAIADHLPQLGVTRCFIVLFDQGGGRGPGGAVDGAATAPASNARLALAYVDGAVQPIDSSVGYDIDTLLPGGSASGEGPPLTVAPLSAGNRQYGLLLYRQDPSPGYAAEAVQRDLVPRIDAFVARHALDAETHELRDQLTARTSDLEAEIRNRLNVEEELRRANRELTRSLLVDSLTGIHNRASLDECLDREFAAHTESRRPLAFLMIDVDHFKSYNDRYGHVQGDATLRDVAGRLRVCARRAGDVAARYGGEEFALVLPDTDGRGAARVAKGLLDGVRNAQIEHAGAPSGRITVSIGVAALVPTGEWVVADLVGAADAALYQAKAAGRDHVVEAEPHPGRETRDPSEETEAGGLAEHHPGASTPAALPAGRAASHAAR